MFNLIVYAPDIHAGDAVGNHCLSLAKLARRLNLEVNLYAQRHTSDIESVSDAKELFNRCLTNTTIFVSYSIYDELLEAILALPCRKVCYFHGVTPPELLQDFEPITAELCQKSLSQLSMLSNFDVLIANSAQTAEFLRQVVGNVGLQVIPPVFADMGLFRYKSVSVGQSIKTLLCVGRVVPHKRVELVIEVFAKVYASIGGSLRLSIVGAMTNYDYAKYLINYARKLDVLSQITFNGVLHETDLHDMYLQSAALISTSAHEGFGVPALEAMHFGIPVFAVSGTAMDAFIVPPGAVSEDLASLATDVIHYLKKDFCDDDVEKLRMSSFNMIQHASDAAWEPILVGCGS